jgi:3-hydroxyisobutyrate dehydrogenase-like beta-hydroxyacid dehydrogenase
VTTVGFLGLGEAGSLIAADLAAAGVTVRGWDPLVPESEGVQTTAGPAEVAAGAEIVVSVNSAHDAMDAARSVLAELGPGQLYADFNTAAPGRKQEVAAAIEPSGAAFADVALLQSVPGRGLRTPALASGPGAPAFAERFGALGMPVEVGTDEPGFAASRKLARSVFLKGLAAAAAEALAAGEALGCEAWLRDDLARWLDGADAAAFDHLVEGSRRHAVRRRDEMEAAVAMLEELGVAPRVAAASEGWLGELAASQRA